MRDINASGKNMKNLKFSFDLNCKFGIYVPSTMDVDEVIDNSAEVVRVIGELSSIFGGATATPALGGWVTEKGSVVVEKTTIVYSFCTSEQAAEHFEEVLAICERIKREYRQEAVTLEYNGQIKFV